MKYDLEDFIEPPIPQPSPVEGEGEKEDEKYLKTHR